MNEILPKKLEFLAFHFDPEVGGLLKLRIRGLETAAALSVEDAVRLIRRCVAERHKIPSTRVDGIVDGETTCPS